MGGVVAAVGLLFSLCVFIGGPALLPWYWEPHAPEFAALIGGFLISSGILFLYWRYSLRMLLGMLFLSGTFGWLGQELGRRTPQTHALNISSTPLLEGLLNEGLVGTLVERGVFASASPPLRAYRDFAGRLCLDLYPHADARVLRLAQAVEAFVLKIEGLNASGSAHAYSRYVRHRNRWVIEVWDGLEKRDNDAVAVDYWFGTLAKRFGPEHAKAILRKSAEVAADTSLGEALREAGRSEELPAAEPALAAALADPPVPLGPPEAGDAGP